MAVLLNALVPTVSLAFEPAPKSIDSVRGGWIEICSTQGSSWVLLGPDGQLLARTTQAPQGAPAVTHEGHCPYCLVHAASFGLPPAPAEVLPVSPWSADLLPLHEPHLPRPLAWMVPAVRAPPSSC